MPETSDLRVLTGWLPGQAWSLTVEAKFLRLRDEWKSQRGPVSSTTKLAMHPAYQKIIGMGELAVPLILKDLTDNGPDDWFWALTAITDENPIAKESAGDMRAMTEAWLQWGRNAGYLKDSPKRRNGSSRT